MYNYGKELVAGFGRAISNRPRLRTTPGNSALCSMGQTSIKISITDFISY